VSTEKAPEACQALELDRVMLRIPDRRRDGMQEICVIVGTRMPQLRECPVPREEGREGGESRGLSQAAGSLNVHPPIHPSILHRLKFCCGDYIASARANLPQACRLNGSRDEFEARVPVPVARKQAECNRATVQGWVCGRGTVVGLWWDCGGTGVVPAEVQKSRISMALQRWQAESGVEWDNGMGMRFCHSGQEPSRSLSAERSRSVIPFPPFSPSGPSMPSLTHVAQPLAIIAILPVLPVLPVLPGQAS
jgi:hypothetical protein